MARRPATRRLDRIALVLVLAPLALWLGAIGVTLALGAAGCAIDEGSAHPCTLAELDLSDFAYTTGIFAAWGGLLMLPFSGGFALLWAVVRLILLMALPRSATGPGPEDKMTPGTKEKTNRDDTTK
ncbi:hypothetical protein [Pseudooceanicola marinus]|uniref:hypothetical protein n=1 Tax=Pseudooceanicola marinus TaxID=396013 RepID=UPI001CD51656|nr:hypothetical protein [Pseudooceanicola marinus]MCA1337133.1 hypothetical protein [Pseudooceanicola marinus]